MKTYRKMVKDYNVIKQFCELYRPELEVIGSCMAEKFRRAKYNDYKRFISGLSFNEFVGNYMSTLFVEEGLDCYKDVLNDKISFNDYVCDVLDLYGLTDMYKEKIKKVKNIRA